MDKFSSIVDRMHFTAEFKVTFFDSLISGHSFLKYFSVFVVDSATHSQKDDTESNGSS
jgi:hypothetical protein